MNTDAHLSPTHSGVGKLRRRLALCASVLSWAAWGCSAKSAGSEPLGGETHWLSCEGDEDCGPGAACECNVCLVSCSSNSECQGTDPGAVCRPPSQSTLSQSCTVPSAEVCVPSGERMASTDPAGATPASTDTSSSPVTPPNATDVSAPTAGSPEDSALQANVIESDQVFLLDIPEANWYEPRGIGEDLGPFVPVLALTVGANGISMTSIDASGKQDACSPTTQLAAAGSDLTAAAVPLHIRHITDTELAVNVTLYEVSLLGLYDPSVGSMTGATDGRFEATLDMRDFYPMFTLLSNDPTPEDVCGALEGGLGVPCEVCPHDGASYCLHVLAVLLSVAQADLSIAPNTAASCVGASD